MANVKVSELREAVKKDKNDIRTVEYDGITIEVKQYIPIQDKISLAETVYQASVDTDNGLHIVDDNSVDMAFRVLLVDTYTNLTLPKTKVEDVGMILDIVESYNLLCESRLYNIVYDSIPDNEIWDLDMIVSNHINTKKDEYEQESTYQNIIKNGINDFNDNLAELIDKIPDGEETKKFIEEVSKELENFDPKKMKYVNEFMKLNSGGK